MQNEHNPFPLLQQQGNVSPDALPAKPAMIGPGSVYRMAQERGYTGSTALTPVGDDDAEIARLAALPLITYEREREAAAEALGLRVSVLDALVNEKRAGKRDEADSAELFPEDVPWPAPVEGAALLDEIARTVRRFIVCTPDIAHAVALWVAFTWLIDRVEVAPLLLITAPEKRCGKSQLLNQIGLLSNRPLVCANISPAAVYRAIEAFRPTLLMDEADTFLKENEELRGVINSGHTRQSAYVIRTVGDDHEPRRFSTWGAKAISGIGHLSETLMDRAIVLELRRKLAHETAERLRHAEPGLFTSLRAKLARFALDGGAVIETARPSLPDKLNDRAQDNWEPLLAIADQAGGHWPVTARTVALRLSGDEQEAMSLSTELLADIRDSFGARKVDRLSTFDLLTTLNSDQERPWATYRRGQPMTPRDLAKRLGEYGISSKNLKTGHGAVNKGFMRADFDDAFARYLTPDTPAPSAIPLPDEETQGKPDTSEVAVHLGQTATALIPPLPATMPQIGSGVAAFLAGSGAKNVSATLDSAENKDGSGVAPPPLPWPGGKTEATAMQDLLSAFSASPNAIEPATTIGNMKNGST